MTDNFSFNMTAINQLSGQLDLLIEQFTHLEYNSNNFVNHLEVSIENIKVDALINFFDDISFLIGETGELAQKTANGFTDTLVSLVQMVGANWSMLFSQIDENFTAMFEKVSSIEEKCGTFEEFILKIEGALETFEENNSFGNLIEKIDEVIAAISEMSKAVVGALKEINESLNTRDLYDWIGIAADIATVLVALSTALSAIAAAIIAAGTAGGTAAAVFSVIAAAVIILGGYIAGLSILFYECRDTIAVLIKKFLDSTTDIENVGETFRRFKEPIKSVIKFLRELVEFIMDPLGFILKKLGEIGKEAILNIGGGMDSEKNNLFNNVNSIGENIAKGIKEGILRKKNEVLQTVSDVGSSIVSKFKSIFAINSPSKVFAKEVGIPISEGIASGISAGSKSAVMAAEDLSECLYDTATQWIGGYQKSIEYITSEEIAMWEMLNTQYKAGAKEKAAIQKKISTLYQEQLKAQGKTEQEAFEHSKNWIETKKNLGILSLQEEYEAWERIQSRYMEGTAEREEADKALIALQQEYANQAMAITEEMTKLEEDYQQAVENRADSIYRSFGLFNELKQKTDEEKTSKEQLINNLEGQVHTMQKWSDQLNALADRNVFSNGAYVGFIEELQAMGPSAYDEIEALYSMSEEELATYAELWEDKHRIAKEQAVRELEELRRETDDQIDKLMTSLETIIGNRAYPAGEQFVQLIMGGISSREGSLLSYVRSLGEAAARAYNAGISSASFTSFSGSRSYSASLNAFDSYDSLGLNGGIQIIQNIQSVPQTPSELMAATRAGFETARWAF